MSVPNSDYKKLSVSERIQLVEDIWDSIAEDAAAEHLALDADQLAELDRRLAAHDADPGSSIPWEHARHRMFRRDG